MSLMEIVLYLIAFLAGRYFGKHYMGKSGAGQLPGAL